MKISCLIGSPRKNSNSAAIAAKFAKTAASLGAQVETVVLNDLTYRGCQGCMACKTTSEKCVLDDDLAGCAGIAEAGRRHRHGVAGVLLGRSGTGQVLHRPHVLLHEAQLFVGNQSFARPAGEKAGLHRHTGSAAGKSVCRHSAEIHRAS